MRSGHDGRIDPSVVASWLQLDVPLTRSSDGNGRILLAQEKITIAQGGNTKRSRLVDCRQNYLDCGESISVLPER